MLSKLVKVFNVFIWLILIVGAGAAFYYVINRKEIVTFREQPVQERQDADEKVEREANSDKVQVVVFYPDQKEWEIKATKIKINKYADQGQMAGELIQELTESGGEKNNTRYLPQGTKVRHLFVTPDGVAYLDLSNAASHRFSGGSLEEYLIVYSIVDTLVYNLKGIVKVQILMNGKEAGTMAGHIDISEPLMAAFSLVREM